MTGPLPDSAFGPSPPVPSPADQGTAGPGQTRTLSRGFLIELVGNMVVFFLCTLVCLQVFAAAQTILERSQAISDLGQVSVSLIENWQSGSDLAELQRQFGGSIDGDVLAIGYSSALEPVGDLETARLCLTFSVEPGLNGYSSGHLTLTMGDEVLIDWPVGRCLLEDGRSR